MRKPDIKHRAAEALASLGWVQTDIGIALGYTGSYICQMGVRRPKRQDERLPEMVEMYRSGKTLTEIGVHFGVTRERIRQLLSTVGVSRNDGGAKAKARSRSAAAESRRLSLRDAHCRKAFGCDYETANRLNNGEAFYKAGTRAQCFYRQRHSACNRGIEWSLTFPEWCQIWDDSGKWNLRGRGRGRYCMSRSGDQGPYAVGNVRIVLNEVNIAESYIHTPGRARVQASISRRIENERKAVALKSGGLKNIEIAHQLGLSAGTITQYLLNAKRREEAHA